MTYFRQYLKNGLVYALIGIATIGGLYGMPSFVQAESDWTECDWNVLSTQFPGAASTGGAAQCGSGSDRILPTLPSYLYGVVMKVGEIDVDGSTPDPVTFRYEIDDVVVDTFSLPKSSFIPGQDVYLQFDEPILVSSASKVGVTILADQRVSFLYSDAFSGVAYNYQQFGWNGTPVVPLDTSTRFISVSPTNGTTTATTTNVGAEVFINSSDFTDEGRLHIRFTQDSAFACMNSGALYDALNTCAGDNSPHLPFDVDFDDDALLVGIYELSRSITFPGGGKWTGVYEIQNVSQPWYFFGLGRSYTTIVSTTTSIVIGQLSPMDEVREVVASSTAAINQITKQGIGAILASTTASLKAACSPLSWDFNLGDCLVLIVWPGEQAIADDITIIKQLPPWGYAFRLVDILQSNISTTTALPVIDYSFASSSPMAAIGNIHFDPFGLIQQSGTLIDEMTSDRDTHLTVWEILMPVINIFIILVLLSMMIHDVTGVYKHDAESRRGKNT